MAHKMKKASSDHLQRMKTRNETEKGSEVNYKEYSRTSSKDTTSTSYRSSNVLTLQPEETEQVILKKFEVSTEQLEETERITFKKNDVSTADDTERISLMKNDISTVAPDGGWGWMVVFGSFLVHLITDGILYSFGIFYIEFLEYYKGGKGKTAWIGSLAVGFQLFAGPLASVLTNKFGCRFTTILGSVAAALGFVLSIFSPNLFFLYFSFGILSGIGFCLTYFPAIVSVGLYFEKKRTFAVGLASCGSGIGAFIFNPVSKYLIDMYAWRGAILIQAGILLNCVLCGTIFRPLEKQKASRHETIVVEKPQDRKENFALTSDDTEMKLFADCYDYANTNNQSLLESPSTSEYVRTQHGACKGKSGLYHREGALHKTDNQQGHGLLAGDMALQFDQHKDLQQTTDSDTNTTAFLDTLERKGANIELFQDDNTKLAKKLGFVNVRSNINLAIKQACNLSPLKDVVFIMYLISNVLASLCLGIPFIFMYDFAIDQGIDSESAKWLGSIIGIVNTIGRVLSGVLADKFKVNRLLLFNTTLTICGIATVLCPLCVNYTLLVLFSCVFGLSFGIYIPLMSVVLVDLLGLEMLTHSFGLLLMFKGMGNLIGPPVAGWLYDATGSYDIPFIAGGITVTTSGILLYFVTCIKRCRKAEEFESEEPPEKKA